MNVRPRIARPIVLAACALALAGGAAFAQSSANIFSQNCDQPMHIEATKLEVRDKERVATFTGNVQVVQGDMTVRCGTMVVHYEENKSPAGNKKPAQQQQQGASGQQISRLEAKGNVVVIQKDQTATGDSATFDVRTNTITMRGNVVINKGQDVTRGDVVVVDLTTGVSTVNTAGKGPVQVLINTGSKSAPASPMRPASR